LENAGIVTEIVTGKTATLSEGKLEVKSFYVNEKKFCASNDFFGLGGEMKEKIIMLITLNTDVIIEEINDVEKRYEAIGSPIEVGMMNFLV
jgi:magnesium-transporting ATPase (P-type)